MRSLPIVCSVLLVCGLFTTNVESVSTTPKVVIDGCTINSTLDSPTTLSLGTTLILVCRISGIPHGLQTNYQWTCPNGPCQQTGYDGRKINNNSIAINITSTSDGGTYICTVTAEGREASQQFILNVNGGQVVHSYGRLIFHERVITDKQQLQPPNNDSGDGRIECRVSSGEAEFSYHGRPKAGFTSEDVHEIRNASTATVVIRDRAFNNFVNFEGKCAGIYHYLFLSNDTLPNVSITGTTSTNTSIKVNIGEIPSGIGRVIIGYYRLDLGVPVVGEYANNEKEGKSRTFSSLVPGAEYRITAWGLSGGGDRRRSQSPAVREVTTMEQTPSPPRHLTIASVCDDGIELNWIPPREPNGDIRHYTIKYTTQDGTQQEINTTNNINYYNILKGLERGQTYSNIRVVAVNSAGGGKESQPITSYVHNPTVECTKSPEVPGPSPMTTTVISSGGTVAAPQTTTEKPTEPSGTPTSSLTTSPPTRGTAVTEITSTTGTSISNSPSTEPNLNPTPTPSPTISTPTDSTTIPQNITGAPSNTPSTDGPIPIIGGAAGGITLLLVCVLGIIICTIAIVRTRRGKRNRTTLYDQPVFYSTPQAGEQDVHEYTLPRGEHQQDNYKTGGQYDEVVIKLKPQPSIPSGYEMTYALPDKQKGKKTDDKGRKEQDSQDPELLYTKVNKQAKTERKEETYKGKVEPHYTNVNVWTKKGEVEPQYENAGIIEQQNISPPDLRLGYEPIADGDSTPQQQDGEGNTTQPTPSATVEGLYA